MKGKKWNSCPFLEKSLDRHLSKGEDVLMWQGAPELEMLVVFPRVGVLSDSITVICTMVHAMLTSGTR